MTYPDIHDLVFPSFQRHRYTPGQIPCDHAWLQTFFEPSLRHTNGIGTPFPFATTTVDPRRDLLLQLIKRNGQMLCFPNDRLVAA